uniref:Uncharacterized protein n=1 Tax=Sphingobacterium sp. (strain 21) TaxID=743722 RepID=F4C7G6_SPHS2
MKVVLVTENLYYQPIDKSMSPRIQNTNLVLS